MAIEQKSFDAMYGDGMLTRIQNIINDLAPVTRRDDWWASDGPYNVLAMHLLRSGDSECCRKVAEENALLNRDINLLQAKLDAGSTVIPLRHPL